MDSENSRIWEEALCFAEPLPVPKSDTSTMTTVTTRSTDNLNNNKDTNRHSLPETCIDTNPKQLCTSDTTNCTNLYPSAWNSCQTADDVSSTSKGLIETLLVSGGRKVAKSMNQSGEAVNRNCDRQSDVSTTFIDSSDSACEVKNPPEIINKSIEEHIIGNVSSTNHSLLNMQGLSIDSLQDISDELAAGLRMIQQGNELIAKALKLSNAKETGVRSPLSYPGLEPISMPSSVESVNIPSDVSARDVDSVSISSQGPSEDNSHQTKQSLANEDLVPTDADSVSCDDTSSQPKIKRRRRREKNLDLAPRVPVLPPCRICDEKSSGFHYGANTCEACKGFFRRTLKKNEVSFSCKCTDEEKQAWKKGPYKNGCPSCRYARCLKVGMSKDAIKIGRYTLNRKTKNIREVKSLEAFDTVIENAIYSTVYPEGSPSSMDLAVFGSVDTKSSSGLSPTSDSPSSSSQISEMKTSTSQQCPLTIKEIESIVYELTETHKSCQVVNEDLLNRPKELVDELHRNFFEHFQLQVSVFGQLKPLSRSEYNDFYNATGIDIDGRQTMVAEALKHLTENLEIFVEFAKGIPGFSDLCLQDQANLIKHSRPEQMVLASYRGIIQNFSPDLQVLTTPWGKEKHVSEISKVIPIDMIWSRVKFFHQFKRLELSLEEEALIRAIAITFSDRCELENARAVQDIQYKLVACLEHVLGTRGRKMKTPLYKLFDILVDFREFSEKEFKMTRELVLDWPMMSSNPLLREFCM